MRLKKILLIVAVWLTFSQASFATICVNVGGNLDVYSALTAEAATIGNKLAFQDEKFTDYYFFTSNDAISLKKNIQQSIYPCSIVLGLVTSRECLIAGPSLKAKKIIGISPICGHNDINKYFPYLYSASPPISQDAKIIVNYLDHIVGQEKIFVIYQPTNLYSEAEFSQFKKRLSKDFTTIPVDIDDQIDYNKLSYNADDKIIIIFFTYPLSSMKIILKLSSDKLITKNVTIIGASSWSIDTSIFKPYKFVLSKAHGIFMIDMVNWDQIKKKIILKKFASKFDNEPLLVEILSYDVAKLAIKCYKKSFITKSNFNIKNFRQCITQNTFEGITPPFSFSKDSSFANRSLLITNLLNRLQK
jgi:hypothetical protein